MKSEPSQRRASRVRGKATAIIAAFSAAVLGMSVPAAPAAADTFPPAGTPPTVSVDPLPTWQVDGVVWSMTTVGSTVYATGNFTKARPPGAAAGSSQEVTRNNLLAFDLETGNLITSFNHSLNGQGLRVVASPDGQRVYVGGEFTTVDGQPRNRLAAFDTATGALVSNFAPNVSSTVRAIAATDSTVYFGGNFFNVNGKSRTRLAAVKASDGSNVDTWRPIADDDEVFAMVMAPGDERVIIGGRFQKLNGVQQVGIGAVNTTDGASVTWTSKPIPTRLSTKFSYVTDLFVQGDTVYGSADGEGGHWFDGRFAAKAANGDLVWLDNCYGATYGMFVQGQSVYSVSHAHDCSSVGAFPEQQPRIYQRALAETTYPTGTDQAPPGTNSNYSGQPVPSQLHWYPLLAMGSFTKQYQAAWTVTGNDRFVAMGGEFPRVNGKAQQGLVRFALKADAPNKSGPIADELGTPTATTMADGSVRVGWKTTWDMDNAKLEYQVLRDGGGTPIGTVEKSSTFWEMPTVAFIDRTAEPGESHTYRIRAVDPSGNAVTSGASNAATPGSAAPGPYSAEVASDGPAAYWRLGEPSGPGYDYAGMNDLTFGSGAAQGQAGAISGDADRAVRFDGGSGGTAASGAAPALQEFTIEAWVKTTSGSGGKIIGYGNATSGDSTRYDRHLYMTDDGGVVFGVHPDVSRTVRSSAGLNDGQWHHVVGMVSDSAGMKLFVDGAQVAADSAVKGAEAYTGNWRIGGDNVSGSWPDRPSSNYLNGTIDEVAVYPRALTADEVQRHHGVGAGAIKPNEPPTAAFTFDCTKLECTFDGSGSTDSDGSIASYAWDFGDDQTGAGATSAHTYAAAGTYTVTLKVTDDQGATHEVSHEVTAESDILAVDAFGRTVSNGWGTADTGGAWSKTGSGGVPSVSGGVGRVELVEPQNDGGGHLYDVSSTDTDLSFRVAIDKEATGNGVYVWAVGRRVTNVGDYRARVRLLPNGVVGLELGRVTWSNSGADVVAEKAVQGLTYQPGQALHLRFQVTGTSPTTLKAKVWADGTAEPAEWQITGTDDTAAYQTAGAVGVRTYLSGSTTNAPFVVSVDDLKAVRVTG